MKVKCINDKGCKLVKDHIYEVNAIANSKVYIKNGSNYKVDRFETLDGTDINIINLPWNRNTDWKIIDETDLDQWVKCRRDSGSKYLIKGELYKISDTQMSKSNDTTHKTFLSKVKVEGINHWLSAWRFIKLNLKEERKVKLKKVDKKTIKKEYKRKFDSFSIVEKEKILLRLIYENFNEKEKHGYDKTVSELILLNDRIFGLTKTDLDKMGEVKLKDILNI